MKILKISLWLWLMAFIACKDSSSQASSSTTQTAENKADIIAVRKNILFFGNSLTAAYGLEDVSKGFVGLTQNRIDSLKLPYRCINAGLSGETTAGGASRVDWVISQQTVDIFVLELGGNDALRGLKVEQSLQNLQTIIDKVRRKYPSAKILLAGMEAPRNMGKTYTIAFHDMYLQLARKNNLSMIPFILEGVGGVAELNQRDGIHPTEAGNLIIAELVWKSLKDLL